MTAAKKIGTLPLYLAGAFALRGESGVPGQDRSARQSWGHSFSVKESCDESFEMEYRGPGLGDRSPAARHNRALADEAFYKVPIGDLKFTQGELPGDSQPNAPRPVGRPNLDRVLPRAVVDGEGEVYVYTPGMQNPWVKSSERADRDSLVIRVAAPRKITGTLFWPQDSGEFVKLPFAAEAEPSDEAKTEFLSAKNAYYTGLMNRGVAGTAWFRHQLRELRRSAGKPVDEAETTPANRNQTNAFDQTFGLFSGGRAISENLQLDRLMAPAAKGEELVPLDSLKGITVAEIDWKPLIKGMNRPPILWLGWCRPINTWFCSPISRPWPRSAIGSPSKGRSSCGWPNRRSSDAQLVTRYERQLGLSLCRSARTRTEGDRQRGSDRLGSVFCRGPTWRWFLKRLSPRRSEDKLWAQITALAGKSAQKVEGKIGKLSYQRPAIARPASLVVCGGAARRGGAGQLALSNRAIGSRR